MLDFGMTIGGRQVAAREKFVVSNPATGETLGHAPNATVADLDAAVDAARAAFPAWAGLPDDQRQAACAALAGKLGDHAEEIARLLTMEQGKPLGGLGSRFEIGGAQAWAGHTASLSLPMRVIQDDAAGRVELLNSILPPGVLNVVTSDDKLANIGAAMSAQLPRQRRSGGAGPRCATGDAHP